MFAAMAFSLNIHLSLPKVLPLSLLLSYVFFKATSVSGDVGLSGSGTTGSLLSGGNHPTEDDALFLTPYIEMGQIEKAQNLAKVPPMLKNVQSFAGYLTVNKSTSSNMFMWLFKSHQGDWESQPLVLWLQGGPGASSTFGLFTEVGPFYLTKKQKLKRRKYSWNRKSNLLFIDNPVGSGFSFTKKDSGYANDETDVARDLYEALIQLYKLFPALKKNKLFITGESYAGKYIPALAYKIYKTNKVSAFKINLAGLMIGNAFTDPLSINEFASFIYNVGLVDKETRDKFLDMEDEARADILAGQFVSAANLRINERKQIRAVTGLRQILDFVNDGTATGEPESFMNSSKTRKAVHVGSYEFSDGDAAYDHLENDVMQSIRPLVEELLTVEDFPIMFFSGQLDIVVAYPASVKFYNNLQWPRAYEYYKAKRCQFKVRTEVAGYYKSAGTLIEVLVRNTGHLVPTSQPKWAFELLDRFITNSSSFVC